MPEREAWLTSLSDQEALLLRYEWAFWARQAQLPPADPWHLWVIKTGRGWGKTRTGAETVRAWVESGRKKRIALVSDTAADTRDVMIEGPSGLLAVCPPWDKPKYEPSKRRVTWPQHDAVAIAYAAEAPGLLRGPEHDGAWADELAKWRNLLKPDQEGVTAWSNLMMGLRVGEAPQCIVTTTPRPIPAFLTLLKRPDIVLTGGTSYENRLNVAEEWFSEILTDYEGTRLGRQELGGEVLEDTPGALWTRDRLDALRTHQAPSELVRVVVAVDPAATDSEGSAETGIVVAAIGGDGLGYVLWDESGRYSPGEWGARAVRAYDRWHADAILGEVNNGGDMVGHTVRTAAAALAQDGARPADFVPFKAVHASRGKLTRAEPIAALYEQARVRHVGSFPELEDQLCTWVPGLKSPDRLDALVWALTELMLGRGAAWRWLGSEDDQPTPTADEAAAQLRDRVQAGGGIWMPGQG